MGVTTNRLAIEKPVITDPFSTQVIADNWQAIDDQVAVFKQNTLANRPAAGVAGRIFVSDEGESFYDNGTAWLRIPTAAAGGQHLFEKGTAAEPGLGFDGDNNTGIASLGADKLNLVTAGRWHWEVNASGQLGGLNFSNHTTRALALQKVGQAHPYFRMRVDGLMEWGSGGAAQDVTLSRDAADRLKVGGSLNVAGRALVTGGIFDGSDRQLFAYDAVAVNVGHASNFKSARSPKGELSGGTWTPGMAFIGDTNTGFARRSNGITSWIANGGEGGFLWGGGIRTANGSPSAPSHSFVDDSNTGMYRYGADQLGLVVGGAIFAYCETSGHERRFHLGGEGNDWIGYEPIDEIMSFYMNGGRRVTVRNSGIRVEIDGSKAAPSISFNDPDTGFYHSSSLDQIGLTIDGVVEGLWGRSGVYFQNAYHSTTSSSANVNVTSDGAGLEGRLRRVTSLRSAKKNIHSLTEELLEKGRNLRVVSFESAIDGDDEGRQVGLIAEETAEAFPELAIYEHGELQSVAYDRAGVVALALAQRALDRLDALEQQA